MLNTKTLSTKEFAKIILEMECCMFNFNVELCDVLFTITKMYLGTKLMIVLMNENQDQYDNENYTYAFAMEWYDNCHKECDEQGNYDEQPALKTVENSLTTYIDNIGLEEDAWILDEILFGSREGVEVKYMSV